MTGNASKHKYYPAFFPAELCDDFKKSPKPGVIFKSVESSSFFSELKSIYDNVTHTISVCLLSGSLAKSYTPHVNIHIFFPGGKYPSVRVRHWTEVTGSSK